ncbi:protein kinase C-binding protein 1-like [Ictidomys tridecemlineatus]|nr:protein kinase C-binding protein 1-like [Ictidomys tridecemlineatus]
MVGSQGPQPQVSPGALGLIWVEAPHSAWGIWSRCWLLGVLSLLIVRLSSSGFGGSRVPQTLCLEPSSLHLKAAIGNPPAAGAPWPSHVARVELSGKYCLGPTPGLRRVWWCLPDRSKAEMDLKELSESVQQQSTPAPLISPKRQIHSRFQLNLDKTIESCKAQLGINEISEDVYTAVERSDSGDSENSESSDSEYLSDDEHKSKNEPEDAEDKDGSALEKEPPAAKKKPKPANPTEIPEELKSASPFGEKAEPAATKASPEPQPERDPAERGKPSLHPAKDKLKGKDEMDSPTMHLGLDSDSESELVIDLGDDHPGPEVWKNKKEPKEPPSKQDGSLMSLKCFLTCGPLTRLRCLRAFSQRSSLVQLPVCPSCYSGITREAEGLPQAGLELASCCPSAFFSLPPKPQSFLIILPSSRSRVSFEEFDVQAARSLSGGSCSPPVPQGSWLGSRCQPVSVEMPVPTRSSSQTIVAIILATTSTTSTITVTRPAPAVTESPVKKQRPLLPKETALAMHRVMCNSSTVQQKKVTQSPSTSTITLVTSTQTSPLISSSGCTSTLTSSVSADLPIATALADVDTDFAKYSSKICRLRIEIKMLQSLHQQELSKMKHNLGGLVSEPSPGPQSGSQAPGTPAFLISQCASVTPHLYLSLGAAGGSSPGPQICPMARLILINDLRINDLDQ